MGKAAVLGMNDAIMTEPVKQPPELLLKLDSLGTINLMHITYQQTGTDTADTFVRLKGDGGEFNGLWHSVASYLDVRVDYASCCRIKREHMTKLEEWYAFEKKNKRELAEYKRLKAKFG